MSNYENAPATKLLATHCAACCRPLVDAVSVEAGMGPDCRKKYLTAETSPENRAQANKLVSEIALAISSSSREGAKLAASKIAEIEALGFGKLAAKLTKAFVPVVITRESDKLVIKAPFSETMLAYSRSIPGRLWDATRKVTTFPASSGDLVWNMLRVSYPGVMALGPKGAFQIK